MYNAYITRIKNLRKHSNADRLQVATVFGNDVIVGLSVKVDDLMVYFPTDGRLNIDYCRKNKLLREKDENGNQIGGYMEESKRHVTTIKLRGECSDGLLMSIDSLKDFTDISKLKEGDTIDILNGVVICEKYIPITKQRNTQNTGNKKTKLKIEKDSFPLFKEHIDTAQLSYNLHQFKQGDVCSISLKMHGTSGRISHTIKETKRKLPKILNDLLYKLHIKLPIKKSWEYVSGSRRVILKQFEGGFYEDNYFREEWHNFFKGKLHKGETIYFEIVGYINENKTIMPDCNNKKVNDREFLKQYGETTRFSYGCENGKNDIYAYRMTLTNEDGYVVEYSPIQLALRCEQMGVKICPEFERFIFTTQEDLSERVNKYIDGIDPIGKTHIREGVVVRVENSDKFKVFKSKNVSFKILEGIIKSEDIVNIEEQESSGSRIL